MLFNYLSTPADTGKPMLRIIVFVFVFVFAFVCVFVIIVVIVEVIFFPMMHSMWGVTWFWLKALDWKCWSDDGQTDRNLEIWSSKNYFVAPIRYVTKVHQNPTKLRQFVCHCPFRVARILPAAKTWLPEAGRGWSRGVNLNVAPIILLHTLSLFPPSIGLII